MTSMLLFSATDANQREELLSGRAVADVEMLRLLYAEIDEANARCEDLDRTANNHQDNAEEYSITIAAQKEHVEGSAVRLKALADKLIKEANELIELEN